MAAKSAQRSLIYGVTKGCLRRITGFDHCLIQHSSLSNHQSLFEPKESIVLSAIAKENIDA